MHRDQETDGVNAVSDTTKRKSEFHTQSVNKGTGKKTDDSKCTVERGILHEANTRKISPIDPRFPLPSPSRIDQKRYCERTVLSAVKALD